MLCAQPKLGGGGHSNHHGHFQPAPVEVSHLGSLVDDFYPVTGDLQAPTAQGALILLVFVYTDTTIDRLKDLHRACIHECACCRSPEELFIPDRNLNEHSHDSGPFSQGVESPKVCPPRGFPPSA